MLYSGQLKQVLIGAGIYTGRVGLTVSGKGYNWRKESGRYKPLDVSKETVLVDVKTGEYFTMFDNYLGEIYNPNHHRTDRQLIRYRQYWMKRSYINTTTLVRKSFNFMNCKITISIHKVWEIDNYSALIVPNNDNVFYSVSGRTISKVFEEIRTQIEEHFSGNN